MSEARCRLLLGPICVLAAALTALSSSCLERRSDDTLSSDRDRCTLCHGDATRAGDAVLRSAPPHDLLGATDSSYPGVGAHAIHLEASETHAAIACTECHVIPERVDSPGHADDARPAELVFGVLARTGNHSPVYDPVARTCEHSHCHGKADAVWTEPRTSKQACGTCHGLPPRAPHPQSDRCSSCHGEVVDEQMTIIRPELHVDGVTQQSPSECATCHGDASNPAPPLDTRGNSDETFLGVGAHRAHLEGGAFSRPLVCTECHDVPSRDEVPGHIGPLPAEVRLLGVAETDGRMPSFSHQGTGCTDSWCHGPGPNGRSESPSWISATALDCTSCHGAPPPAPHPASNRCSSCHGEVVDEQMSIIRPELHVDGVTQQSPGECATCHGGADSPAPPLDTRGNSDETFLGVGAHRAHLEGGAFSRPLVCTECHDVPSRDEVPGHIGPLPAEVRLLGVAETDGRMPSFSHQGTGCTDSWCHGPGPNGRSESPSWISATALDCTSCHGAPPPAPHPASTRCSSCHGEVVAADDVTIVKRSNHVNGMVDVSVNESCTSCHGDDNPAPPRDLAGNTDMTAPGVGAHQIHLSGTERSRAVPCNECHVVPDRVLAAGHLDSSGPAEVSFAGAALAFGGGATYANGRCSSVSCHGALLPEGHASGGTDTAPSWLDVTGLGATCGSCHGLPPPAPHPRGDLNPSCSACHENIEDDNRTFIRPELHVDGIVTFTLP